MKPLAACSLRICSSLPKLSIRKCSLQAFPRCMARLMAVETFPFSYRSPNRWSASWTTEKGAIEEALGPVQHDHVRVIPRGQLNDRRRAECRGKSQTCSVHCSRVALTVSNGRKLYPCYARDFTYYCVCVAMGSFAFLLSFQHT